MLNSDDVRSILKNDDQRARVSCADLHFCRAALNFFKLQVCFST